MGKRRKEKEEEEKKVWGGGWIFKRVGGESWYREVFFHWEGVWQKSCDCERESVEGATHSIEPTLSSF